MMLRVLIACEFSGRVRDAFLKRGFDAWSCDLLPTEVPEVERRDRGKDRETDVNAYSIIKDGVTVKYRGPVHILERYSDSTLCGRDTSKPKWVNVDPKEMKASCLNCLLIVRRMVEETAT